MELHYVSTQTEDHILTSAVVEQYKTRMQSQTALKYLSSFICNKKTKYILKQRNPLEYTIFDTHRTIYNFHLEIFIAKL